MEIKLTLQNGKELLKTFKAAPAIAAKEYRDSLERIAANVVMLAQKNAPVNKGEGGGKRGYGGNLRQSIRYFPYGNTGFMVRVGAEYGVYVDQGTKPHVILPRTKPYLAFQINGRWIYTKRVNHPGTKPTFFFTNAVKATEPYANAEMGKAMDRVLNQL